MPRKKPNPDPRTLYVGVDPGASGAMAALLPDGSVDTCVNAGTLHDRWDDLRAWVSELDGSHSTWGFAVLERVHSMPGQGVVSTFTFGASFGELRAMLAGAGLPYREVTPQKWQTSFGLKRGKDEAKTAFKNRLKAEAQRLYPGVKVTLSVADALLIATYCKRLREGTL